MPSFNSTEHEILRVRLWWLLLGVLGWVLVIFFFSLTLVEIGKITLYILFSPPGYANQRVCPYLPPIQTLWFIAFEKQSRGFPGSEIIVKPNWEARHLTALRIQSLGCCDL